MMGDGMMGGGMMHGGLMGYGGPMAALNLTDEQQDKLFALQERTARRTGIR